MNQPQIPNTATSAKTALRRPFQGIALLAMAAVGLAFSGDARADEGPDEGPVAQCEFRGLIKTLQQMALTTALHDGAANAKQPSFKFDVKQDAISLVDVTSGAAVLKVDCGGASLPDAGPTKGRITKQLTRRLAGRTVSVTALGAGSLDIDAGELFARSFHVLTFDDGSASVSFGTDAASQGKAVLLYSVATLSNGDRVEKEHASVGCGCEKWVTAEGQVGRRPLVKIP